LDFKSSILPRLPYFGLSMALTRRRRRLLLCWLRASTLLYMAHSRQGVARLGWVGNHVVQALLKIQSFKVSGKLWAFFAMLFDKFDEFIKVSEQYSRLEEVATNTRRSHLLWENRLLFVLDNKVDW